VIFSACACSRFSSPQSGRETRNLVASPRQAFGKAATFTEAAEFEKGA